MLKETAIPVQALLGRVHGIVDDRVDQGVFSVHRDAFRDEALFELEMRHVFESTWVFVGLESQAPRPNDYFSSWIGRCPVVITRDKAAQLHCVINSCRHRGAAVFAMEQGNRRYHACPYHGWVYDSGGKCVDVKDQAAGAYSDAFACENHDLVPVARFENYRGFLFASLSPDVPTLDEFLGDTRLFLDLVVDQSPQGVEFVPGAVGFTYNANWKMQVENGVDLYHFTSTHPSYIGVLEERRKRREASAGAGDDAAKRVGGSIYENLAAQKESERGIFSFPYGHVAYWGDNPNVQERPLFGAIDEIRERVGNERADWMLRVRNLVIYPNLQIVENASLQLRTVRPLSVDRTEVRAWCLAPRGETPQARRQRIRQYEDFYNPSGFATPDDTAAYEACQKGHGARVLEWQQGYSRGMLAQQQGGNERAAGLGISPEFSVTGTYNLADETAFHGGHREWMRLMQKGLSRDAEMAKGNDK